MADGTASKLRSPLIACNLDGDQQARLAQHPSRPTLLSYRENQPVWKVPEGAECLFTGFKGWAAAPAAAPPGWPYGLRWVQLAGAGVDIFPPWLFEGPVVTTGRGTTADAIAEYVIAAIFAHEKQLFDNVLVRSPSDWKKRTLGFVAGKRLGVLGLGAIGLRIAAKGQALGMQVGYVRRSADSTPPLPDLKRYASLEAMICDVNHLVVAVPLTAATRLMLDNPVLTQAKTGLHLINVCRGDVLDDDALLAAIERGQIAAATLDVTSPEPLPEGHPFYKNPRIRITPHISYTSEDAAERISAKLLLNLDRYLAGEPLEDIVDTSRGY